MRNKIFNLIEAFEKALFPEYSCIICGREVCDKTFLICENCKSLLIKPQGPVCKICGMPIHENNTLCDDCKSQKLYFEKAVYAYLFDKKSANLVYGLKYSSKKYSAKYLARLLVAPITNLPYFDCIIPVPLHQDKIKLRGYNQCELIANSLSECLNVPVINDLLVRTKNTKSQTGKSKSARKENVLGAFSTKEKLNNKTILLIDDVFTTGATVNECAKILKENGAKSVYVATILKTIN